ncbi:hypothetical protein RKD55_001209 [Rossellomorea marisflavi]
MSNQKPLECCYQRFRGFFLFGKRQRTRITIVPQCSAMQIITSSSTLPLPYASPLPYPSSSTMADSSRSTSGSSTPPFPPSPEALSLAHISSSFPSSQSLSSSQSLHSSLCFHLHSTSLSHPFHKSFTSISQGVPIGYSVDICNEENKSFSDIFSVHLHRSS